MNISQVPIKQPVEELFYALDAPLPSRRDLQRNSYIEVLPIPSPVPVANTEINLAGGPPQVAVGGRLLRFCVLYLTPLHGPSAAVLLCPSASSISQHQPYIHSRWRAFVTLKASSQGRLHLPVCSNRATFWLCRHSCTPPVLCDTVMLSCMRPCSRVEAMQSCMACVMAPFT